MHVKAPCRPTNADDVPDPFSKTETGGSERKTVIATAVAASVICLLVYLRALSCGFVNMDDPDYVLNNAIIRQLNSELLVSVFSQPHVGWWMPLTWISFALDYHFWGLNPVGYHLTNILLHSVNTGLVVLIANAILNTGTGLWGGRVQGEKGSRYVYLAGLLLAGLLWGIHPLRVESVAWVTERKDVLNGLFSFIAILCYINYARAKQQNGKGGVRGKYWLTLFFFSLSLMSKSVSVILPLMLLVADWYPLGRLRNGTAAPLLVEKIPFLVLSAAMVIATISFTAQSQYLVSYDLFPFYQRLMVSGNAIFEYSRLLLFPFGIIAFYVIPDPIPLSYWITSIAVLVFCFACYLCRQHRWLPATWLLFIIPLLPVLAFLQNGDQSYAARFTYLPALAVSIAAAFAVVAGYEKYARTGRRTAQMIIFTAATGLVVFHGGMTVRLIATWENSEALWSRVIDLQPEAIVYKERGLYYYSTGNYHAAIDDFSAALKMASLVWRPYLYNLFAYRGEALRSTGRYVEAIHDFNAAIAQFPRPVYYHLRGLALQKLGKTGDAEKDFRNAGPEPGKLDWYWISTEN